MEPCFYLVWNPQTSTTRYRHDTRNSAQREAERLANQHPGQEFIVLQSISRTRKVDVLTEGYGPEDDGVPF